MLAPNTLIHSRYRIVRLMGQGGMGTVYEAIDERLGHQVALKETRVGGTAQMDHAFEREARVLARLRHPALPVVSDFFTDEAGQFLVMQFVPGDDLAAQLAARGKAFFLEQVLRWANELLDALEYLHSRQPPVLHRDIKPQNLKVGERGEIILLDFGLVKGSALLNSQASGGSSVFGYTPQYAPLEQIQGEGTDQRSDLYALAATLYHLSTNQPPADALRRVSLIARRQTDPLRPPRDINPLLPITFANLLMTALSLDPAERPSSAQAMRLSMHEEPTGKAKALPIVPTAVERPVQGAKREATTRERVRPAPQRPLSTEVIAEPESPRGALYRDGTRPKGQPIWYLWMAGAALVVLLLGGGAWWLADDAQEGVALPPTATVSVAASSTSAPVAVAATLTPTLTATRTLSATRTATKTRTATAELRFTQTPRLPTATPLPLYVLSELLGGKNCAYTGISGTIRNNDGSPRARTIVEIFNESGYKQTLTTNAAGFYEAYLDNKPREDLKGFWHIRVLEGEIQGSNEIVVKMSGNCTEGENQFVANFYRSQ